jgi:small subunit ribosomal protein S21
MGNVLKKSCQKVLDQLKPPRQLHYIVIFPANATPPPPQWRFNVCNIRTAMINNPPTRDGLSGIFRRDVKDVYVTVRDNNVDQALRVLKKKMQREGVFREMKNRRSYEKPSERRAREAAESTRRVRKLMRKRLEREGY